MRGTLIFILVAVAIVFVLTVWADNRIAAGAGALLLLGGIIYGWARNKGTTRTQDIRSEQGAREVRNELAEDEERRGTR
ncbi:hypothetical protein [Aurantiacibacter poecillastricola]|uniref:hypothetical protein n=1 Tax=Aurantiacibacter poecillastricola TaxID=3064385 RepID=UPI00273E734E|nr:hypothetical protein [Aurantiacibacter sp. 219JJ12-13]MDP5260092.1 hypothetical protein [Aurantiacibacter sp. 219JJ12-13]